MLVLPWRYSAVKSQSGTRCFGLRAVAGQERGEVSFEVSGNKVWKAPANGEAIDAASPALNKRSMSTSTVAQHCRIRSG